MRSTIVWTQVSAAFLLHMRCCTKNCLHADGVRTVRGCGWPKYTLDFTSAALCGGSTAGALCMEQSRRFGAAQTTNKTMSNLNSHITIGIGIGICIGICRYHSE